ncbi:GHKL domain-containing protein [Bombilactobacillus bombi]|uniref:sensor histidine kinase n=1 Tax=Bombilactobacillus bombi TaxID=1303590 RepID=UPI000E592B7B|nr:ATP-binding protein [Bombilactobacillus bombi]AXX64813.1 GHKL domain-containing protein [Bombilactobacillus bombi]
MRRQRRTIIITALVGILIYSFCLFILSQFVKQDQINHLAALKNDYQVLKKDTNRRSLASWADDHQLTVVTDSNHPQTTRQKQVHDVLQQNQLDNTNPYYLQHFRGQRYLLYLLDSTTNNRQRVMVKKYQSVWQHSNLVGLFSAIYLVLWLLIMAIQYFTYRQQRRYLHAIVQKLQQIKANEQTESLITKENTPYTSLIHAVNALDKHNQQQVETNSILKRRFQSLMGHLPVGVMLLDAEGNVLLHNQMLSIMLGKQIAENKHPFVDDIQTYALSRMIEHTLRKNRNHHRHIQLYGDSDRYVDANVIRIAHSSEDLEQQVIVILYDLTNIHQLQQQQLDFIDNVSEKLQPSVTAIIQNVDQLLQQTNSDNEILKQIRMQAQSLDELLDDTVTLNKLDHQENLLPDRVDTMELVKKALQQQQEQINKLHLKIERQWQGNSWVSSYQQELWEIFQNLISNAVKYNRVGGQVLIKVDHNEIENYLNITIKDSGIGIDAKNQKQVFERFYRVDKEHQQGTGLGLAIVQEAVQALNGTIELSSQINKGTLIDVHLPL